MPRARLTEIRLRNFKSVGPDEQALDLRPLTILLGRNNSGKSTILQSLLLLKQTLLDPRPEAQLSLRGPYVNAVSLRELTHGWPEDMAHHGPEIGLTWSSSIDVRRVIETGRRPIDLKKLADESGIDWLSTAHDELRLTTTLHLCYRDVDGIISAQPVLLRSSSPESRIENPTLRITWAQQAASYLVHWADRQVDDLDVRMDHFLPYLVAPREPNDTARLVGRLFRILYEQPLDALKDVLSGLTYVGSARAEPPESYPKPSSITRRDILPGGQNVPELMYGRRAEAVHCAPIVDVNDSHDAAAMPDRIEQRPLKAWVEHVLGVLGVDGELSFVDVQELGVFRLLFSGASLQHVGRGVGYVLPVVVVGLIADPLLGEALPPELSRTDYLARCEYTPCIMLEELEGHLHPKAQTRLAHFMVALARSGRQVLLETHSDHMVRRIRKLVARAAPESESERWLIENVRIAEIERPGPATLVHQAELTREGDIEKWPADFMAEAPDEEESIYFAGMKKRATAAPLAEEEYLRHARLIEAKG